MGLDPPGGNETNAPEDGVSGEGKAERLIFGIKEIRRSNTDKFLRMLFIYYSCVAVWKRMRSYRRRALRDAGHIMYQ